MQRHVGAGRARLPDDCAGEANNPHPGLGGGSDAPTSNPGMVDATAAFRARLGACSRSRTTYNIDDNEAAFIPSRSWWLWFPQTWPAPPPNSGIAGSLEGAKAPFKRRYQEVKGSTSRLADRCGGGTAEARWRKSANQVTRRRPGWPLLRDVQLRQLAHLVPKIVALRHRYPACDLWT